MMDNFWQGKKVLVTGHTGFKGSWLCVWLCMLGAQVAGYALDPPTDPSLFDKARVHNRLAIDTHADIRDARAVLDTVCSFAPDIVFHMAAQPLVIESYHNPIDTFSTNVMGTAHLLDAVRQCPSIRSVVVVTTDKCYENREWHWGYRENDTLGGHDPYAASKVCAEFVTASYRASYWSMEGPAVATARAGNVIGGGDWAKDRLVPDILQALGTGSPIVLRRPEAVRPWQHVLEPLRGYMILAQSLYENGRVFAGSWNFGPDDRDTKSVIWIARQMRSLWGTNTPIEALHADTPHETVSLRLDSSKAARLLGWRPRWTIGQTLARVIEWQKGYMTGIDSFGLCEAQISAYESGDAIG